MLGVIVLALGLVTAGFPRTDRRVQQVKAAAEELAATCRQARALALARNAAYAVVFNLQNDPTGSGRVLNNRSGGHWYRIVGPTAALGSTTGNSRQNLMPDKVDNVPPVVGSLNGSTIFSSPFNLLQMSSGMAGGWAGETHTLPAARVRFVALTDLDYGDFTASGTRRVPSAGISYPRPWFGWWDSSTKRLYPWGGYDHALVDGSGNRVSAFSLEGDDGQLAGCVNPADRSTTDAEAFPIFKQGDERPVVNGAWLDYVIRFNPDGSVQEGKIMAARRSSGLYPAQGSHLGDLINGAYDKNTAMTSYEPYTG
ncbi:MAG: hypothetical protein ACRDUB_23595, partial [Mycobacterium sp.]